MMLYFGLDDLVNDNIHDDQRILSEQGQRS